MTPRNRVVIGAVASALVLLALVVIILVFGFIPVPEYPSLAETPDPSIPGTVAYGTSVEDTGLQCVFVISASGAQAPREVACGEEMGFSLAWTADGLIATDSFEFESAILVLDPQTGREVERISFGGGFDGEPFNERMFELLRMDRSVRADGARVQTGRDREHGFDSRVVVRFDDGTTRELLSGDDAPTNYGFSDSQWSPDGRYVLVIDTEGRLIVIDSEGAPRPRILLVTEEGHAVAAWYIPGNPTYTVELPEG